MYFLMAAAYNLGEVMFTLFGIGISRKLQGMMRAILACFMARKTLWLALRTDWFVLCRVLRPFQPRLLERHDPKRTLELRNPDTAPQFAISSAGD